MDFIILKVNGEDVRNCSHEEAMEVFQRALDPIIVIDVMRRSQPPTAATSPSIFPTPLVGGGGGLCMGGDGGEQSRSGGTNSELSSIVSTRSGVDNGGVRKIGVATRSVAVQTMLSAGDLAASLAIAVASVAEQEARIALLREPASSCVVGNDVGRYLDFMHKQHSCYASYRPAPFSHPHVFALPTDPIYANFPEDPASSSVCDNSPAGEYASSNFEKCFEVILQNQSTSDRFGLTLGYRSSEVQQDLTEVYVDEIEPGSVAFHSGQIMLGDRLVKIGDEEITSRDHAIDLFQSCRCRARITLVRQQPPWKQSSDRQQLSYPVHLYPNSPLLDIGISNAGYAHLPDQDSGMGKTIDDSVRMEESSEQEAEEHKPLPMKAWSQFDSSAGRNRESSLPLASANNASSVRLERTLATDSLVSSNDTYLLDDELIQLSLLMQLLALHCQKLTYIKIFGSYQAKETSAATTTVATPGTTKSAVEEAEIGIGAVAGDGEKRIENSSSSPKARQTPRMGLGVASTSNKVSSANGIASLKRSTTSLGEITNAKPPIQPFVGSSLSSSKLQCVSSNSAATSTSLATFTDAVPNSFTSIKSQLSPRVGETYEGLEANPAYISPMCASGPFAPDALLHHSCNEFSNQCLKNGLQLSILANPLLMPPSIGASGIVSNFRHPSLPLPQIRMFPRRPIGGDKCKDDTASPNIYETPYAAVDIVNTNGNNDNGFTTYGIINAFCSTSTYAGLGEVQSQAEAQNRPLMEWVIKKRNDGTRYITRRPSRNRPLREHSSPRHVEERVGGTIDGDGVDGGGEVRGKSDAKLGSQQLRKGSGSERRRQQQPQTLKGSNPVGRESGRGSRVPSGHRSRGTPTG